MSADPRPELKRLATAIGNLPQRLINMHSRWPFLSEEGRESRLSDIQFLLATFSMYYTLAEAGGFTEECTCAIEVAGPTIIWTRENRHKNAVLVEMDKYPIFSEFTEYFLDEDSGMVTG